MMESFCDMLGTKRTYTIIVFLSLWICSFCKQGTINISCPTGWTKVDLKCLKLYTTPLTWEGALQECQRAGAVLVTLKDIYDIEYLSNLVRTESKGSIKSYWIGLSKLGVQASDPISTVKWNKVTPTITEKGYWNVYKQPDFNNNKKCVKAEESSNLQQWSFYKPGTALWSFTLCKDRLPFVCQSPVCPAGWFRCGDGKCIQQSWKCDGHNDCSDGSDELPKICPSKCDYTLSGATGRISSNDFKGPYVNYMSCVWRITATAGTHVSIKFTNIDVEPGHDVITIYTGDVQLSKSKVLARLSGSNSPAVLQQQFVSDNNVIVVRFYADNTVTKSGFTATWQTGYECSTLSLTGKGQDGTPLEEVTAADKAACAVQCKGKPTCEAAVFSSSKCKIYSNKGKISTTAGSELISNFCPSKQKTQPVLTTPPTFGGTRIATDDWQTISSPQYPFYIPGYQSVTWTIDATESKAFLSIRVDDLDLQVPEYVEVKDGKGAGATALVKYPGSGGTTTLFTTGSSATVVFSSAQQNGRRGFLLSYKQNKMACPAGKDFQWYTKVDMTLKTTLTKKTVDAATLEVCRTKCKDEASFVCKSVEFNKATTQNCLLSKVNRLSMTLMPGVTVENKAGFTYSEWVCTEKCPTIPADANAKMSSLPLSLLYQSKVTITCNDGYYFAVDKYTTKSDITVTCLFGGKWSTWNIPKCTPVYCGPPATVPNGYVDKSGGVLYPATTTYACYEGFTIQGTATISCQKTAKWTALPTCKANVCPTHAKVPLATATTSGGTGTSVGTTVTYKCDDGYQISGAPKLVCASDGKWNKAPPTCTKLKCGTPSIVNGVLTNPTGPFNFGDKVTVKCNTGFKLEPAGTGEISCGANQKFAAVPKCVDIDECKEKTAKCTQVCKNTVGSYECSCNTGYTLESDKITCKDIDECTTNKGGCGQKCKNSAGTYKCECDAGYTLYTADGTNGFKLKSGETGTREGDVYYINHSCVPNECPKPAGLAIANGVATQDMQSLYFNGKITFDCNIGYALKGKAEITCTAVKTWDAAAPTCEKVQCDPASLAGLKYPPTATPTGKVDYLATVTYTCTKFLPKPVEKKRTCRFDSKTKTYVMMGDPLDCPVVDCGPPAAIAGAKKPTLVNTLYNTKYTFECENNLLKSLGKSSLGNNVVTCMAGGYWDYGDLRCLGTTCTDPGRSPGARQQATSYQVGKQVTYSCIRPGYVLDSADPLTCKEDGGALKWSKAIPKCVDKEKPKITCPTNPTVKLLNKVNLALPTSTDNTGIASLTTIPAGFNTKQIVNAKTSVQFVAKDYVGLSETCTVSIDVIDDHNLLPPKVTCPTSYTEFVTKDAQETIKYKEAAKGTHDSGEAVTLTYTPADNTLIKNTASLYKVYTVTVEAKSKAGLTAKCQFQIDVRPAVCSPWYLPEAKDATKTCTGDATNGYTCTYQCKAKYLFHDNVDKKTYSCQPGKAWTPNIYVPDCILPIESPHLERFSIRYTFAGALSDDCAAKAIADLKSKATALGNDLTTYCHLIVTGAQADNVAVKVIQDRITTDYKAASATGKYFTITMSITAGPSHSEADKTCVQKVEDHLDGDLSVNNQFKSIREIAVAGCPKLTNPWGPGTSVKDVIPCDPNTMRITRTGGDNDLCLACSAGYKYDAGTKACVMCPQGTYQDEAGKAVCKPCTTGKWTYGAQAKSANDCKDMCKKYSMISTTKLPPCRQCLVDQTVDDSTKCKSCPAGERTLNTGVCTGECPKGQYSPSGYPPCVKCPPSFYQDGTGQKNCKACPDGKVSKGEGATDAIACVSGVDALCKPTNPCKNGQCDVKIHDVVCTCNKGFTGSLCDQKIDACLSKPCYNNGDCAPGIQAGTYKCTCKTGFSGDNCETEVNDCAASPCKNGGMCQDLVNDYKCMCLPESGYTGKVCTDIKKICEPDPCKNGGTCVSLGNVRYRCDCKAGYTGTDCGTDIDECQPNPCLNGGQCTQAVGSYSCKCGTGYEGKNCEVRKDPCAAVTCSGNGKCLDLFLTSTTKCSCNVGFVPKTTNTCDAIDFCSSTPCKNSETTGCKSLALDYSCTCKTGYEGFNCQHNKDDCASKPCVQGTCKDLLNDYKCTCDTGWKDLKCDAEIDYCNPNPCDTTGSAKCNSLTSAGDFKCDCKAGYSGKKCETNVNDCASLPCLHGAKCTDKVNDYSCDCPAGWEGKQCEKVVDTCTKTPCTTNYQCFAGFVNTACVCKPGFFGAKCDQTFKACDTFKPCLNTGSTCAGTADTWKCTCGPDYMSSGCSVRKDNTIINKEDSSGSTGKYTCLSGFSGNDCQTADKVCPKVTCPSGATCRDAVMAHQCACPIGKAGPTCKAIAQSYDLCFKAPDKDSYAILSKPFSLKTKTLTISLAVRFYYDKSKGGIMTLYGKESWQENAPTKEIMAIDSLGVKITLNGETKPIAFPHSIGNGKWIRITVEIDQGQAIVKVKLMNSGSPATFTFKGDLPNFGVVVLGSTLDMTTKLPKKGTGLFGCISWLGAWNRKLTDAEILQLSSDKAVASGQLLGWEDYDLFGDVTYAPAPADRSSVCPVGTGGQNCKDSVPDKRPPPITCPADVIKTLGLDYTGDSTTVTWPHATSTETSAVMTHDRLPGVKLAWGRHTVIYEMKDANNNAAFCRFHVYIRADKCTQPPNPKDGSQKCETKEGYTICSISCGTKRPSVPTPVFYTCGPAGRWNYQNQFLTIRYPSCSTPEDKSKVQFTLRFKIAYPKLNADAVTLKVLADAVRKAFVDKINAKWKPDPCPSATTCKITATCSKTDCKVEVVSTPVQADLTSAKRRKKRATNQLDMMLREAANKNGEFNNILKTASNDDDIDDEQTLVTLEPICANLYQAVGKKCVICGPGYYYKSTTKTCERCELGTYQPKSGQTSCEDCPVNGQSTQLPGSFDDADCKVNCSAGTYLFSDKTKCIECELNKYQPYDDRTSCIDCDADHITRQKGSTAKTQCIKDCPSGQGLLPSDTCVDCVRGTYRKKGESLECQKCPTGFTTEKPKAISKDLCSIADCLPGSHRDTLAKPEKCVLCKKGFYQPVKLATECKPCDGVKTTQGEGAKLASECKVECQAGYEFIVKDNKCEPCKVGFFRGSGSANLDCLPCPDSGFMTLGTGATTATSCTVANCSAGSYRDTSKSPEKCIPCANGAYQPDRWQLLCKNCPQGTDTGGKTGSESVSDCTTLNQCITNKTRCPANNVCVYNKTSTVTSCVCKAGYSRVGGSCKHVCETDVYCKNGGTCKQDGDKAICLCAGEFVGTLCQSRKSPPQTEKLPLIFGIIGVLVFIILVVLLAVWICMCMRKRAEKKPPSLDIDETDHGGLGAYLNPIYDDQRSVAARPVASSTLRSFLAPSYAAFNDDTSSVVGGRAPSVADSIAVFSPNGRFSTRGIPDGDQFPPSEKFPKALHFDDDTSDDFDPAAKPMTLE